MITILIRLSVLAFLIVNSFYIMTLDTKISQVAKALDITLKNNDITSYLRSLSTSMERKIEHERATLQKALEQKGIDERNEILNQKSSELKDRVRSKIISQITEGPGS
jgi:predicted Holliday junction resolvase-like endonuclease